MSKLLRLVPKDHASSQTRAPHFLSPEDIRAHAASRSDSDDDGSGGFKADLDAHGQPLSRFLNRARLIDRATDELVGLCKGIAADGTVSHAEAQFLVHWLEANPLATVQRPGDMVFQRLQELSARGLGQTQEQAAEILRLVQALIGGPPSPSPSPANLSTALPLTMPPPVIAFAHRLFSLTGKFDYRTRRQCEQAIVARGGSVQRNPTHRTDYLVIGEIGSTDWSHSTHGRKIEEAVAIRRRGRRIAIVSEQHWVAAL